MLPSNEVTAIRHAKDADIGLLGLATQDAPTFSRFPPCFNKKATTQWRDAIDSDEYKTYRGKSAATTHELWTFAIKNFLKRCDTAGISPFSNAKDFESNARSFLKSAREQLVEAIDKHGILEHLRIQSVERKYHFTDKNMRIECIAKLASIQDPTFTQFLRRLPEPNFHLHSEGVYRKSIHAHIDLEFVQRGSSATLAYTVFCHTPIHVLRPELPSKKRLTTFADKELWTPLIKARRFKHAKNKLF